MKTGAIAAAFVLVVLPPAGRASNEAENCLHANRDLARQGDASATQPESDTDRVRAALLPPLPRFEDDPIAAVRQARMDFLDQHDVLSASEGAFGIAFVGRNKATGELFRFKVPFKDHRDHPFEREGVLGARAGKLRGVAPVTLFDKSLHMIRMENIDGKPLNEFLKSDLQAMSAADREIFIQNLMTTLTSHVQRLHEAGILHLDIKPENILICREHGKGTNVRLIDFGISFDIAELPKVHEAFKGRSYAGTPLFMGHNAANGRPTPADDFTSLKRVFDQLFPSSRGSDFNVPYGIQNGDHFPTARPVAFREEAPEFFRQRPLLSSLTLLMEHTSPSQRIAKRDPASMDRMMAIALKKNPTEAEADQYFRYFKTRLGELTPGQQVMVLFGDPVLNSPKFLSRFARTELKALIAEGEKENRQYWDAFRIVNDDRPADTKLASQTPFRRIADRGVQDVDLKALEAAKAALEKEPSSDKVTAATARPISPRRAAPADRNQARLWLARALGTGTLAGGAAIIAGSSEDTGDEKGPSAKHEPEKAPEKKPDSAIAQAPPPRRVSDRPALDPKIGALMLTQIGDKLQESLDASISYGHDAVVNAREKLDSATTQLASMARKERERMEADRKKQDTEAARKKAEEAEKSRVAAAEAEARTHALAETKRKEEEAKALAAKKLAEAEALTAKKAKEEALRACTCRGEWSTESAQRSRSRLCVIRDGEGTPLAWNYQYADDPYCWNSCSPKTSSVDPVPAVKQRKVTDGCSTIVRQEPVDWRWGRGAGYGGEFWSARK